MNRWPPPPRLSRAFYKAHGLGNDYVVFEEGSDWAATTKNVARVCDPHRGLGADGIVVLLADRSSDIFRLRMFNPDGSEFERSGNGLRVLGSFLARRGERTPYTVRVGGDDVILSVHGGPSPTHDISAEMGRARTGPEAVGLDPTALSVDGFLEGPGGEALEVVPVSVGNPHLVVLTSDVTERRLAEVGPFLASHPALTYGANAQIARRVGEGLCRALIWERGVGRTSASGTSACAVAVAMVASGRMRPGDMMVEMPGGALSVRVTEELDMVLRGPVEEVCEGLVAASLVPE